MYINTSGLRGELTLVSQYHIDRGLIFLVFPPNRNAFYQGSCR